MEDKMYPAIYESTSGELYLYLDTANYHSFAIARWRKADGIDVLDHENDKNITREYLQNTYGEVVSPEHAEFIAKLCESNGIELFNNYDEGITQFAINRGELIFTYIKPAISDHDKQITIPLPPKADKQESSEWPQVGDEVQTSTGCGVVVMLPDKNGMYIVMIDGCYRAHSIDSIKKPKTPEDELRDEITELVWKANDLWTSTKEVQQVSVQEFVATKIMDKYNITKKA